MIGSDVTITPFEQVKVGHRVAFRPRDAIGGGRGLRKPIHGRVRHIEAGLAQIGDWMVPIDSVQRLSGDVYNEFSKAARKAERQQVYGSLKPEQKRALEGCAKDARLAFLSTSAYSGPIDKQFLADAKRRREGLMREHGIEDTTDRGQCEALPLFLERALAAGDVPELKNIEYVSADSGVVGVGDTVNIGGKPFKLAGYSPEGKAILKDGYEILVPMESIPRDKGTAIKSVFSLKIKRERRLARTPVHSRKPARPRHTTLRRCRKKRWCFHRGRGGRFQPIQPPRKSWCFYRDRAGHFLPRGIKSNPALNKNSGGSIWLLVLVGCALLFLLKKAKGD